MKKGWESKELGDVCLLDKKKHDGRNLPYVGMEDISSGTGLFLGSAAPHKVKSSTFTFTQNHVLYGRLRPYLNKALIPDFTGHCSTEIFPLLPEETLNQAFLFYWLTAESQVTKINGTCTGARMPRANFKEVLTFPIPIPPLSEQEEIVEVLDKAFAAIDQAKANIEQNIANAKELFQSKLNQIFSQKGEGWVEKTLLDVCGAVFAGGDVPKDRLSKTLTEKYKIPIFSNGEKNKGLYGYTDAARVTEPSITVSARGTIGYSEIRVEPFLPVVRLIVLTPNTETASVEFLSYVVKSMDFKNSGSSIPQLTVPMIKKYKATFPSLGKQAVIVKKLDALTDSTNQLQSHYQTKLASLDELKKSILQKAFAGELT